MESEDWIHEHCSRGVPVIEHVLAQTSVLGHPEEDDEPSPVDGWPADEK